MVIRIRLARFGKRNNPFYNVVVAHARTARNSKPLEVIGTYNPVAIQPADPENRPFKDIKLDVSRAKYWIGVGAQPSDSTWKLFSMLDILPTQFGKQKLREQAAESDRILRIAAKEAKAQKVDVTTLPADELVKKFTEENTPS